MQPETSPRAKPRRARLSELEAAKETGLKFARPDTEKSVEEFEQWIAANAPQEWDVLIAGDGSGSTWNIGCGWCAVLVDRYTRHREVFWGGMSRGSVPIGEIMPYIHSLLWYTQHREKVVYKKQVGPIRVVILCDNLPLVLQGNNILAGKHTPATVGGNNILWRALMGFQSSGYSLKFHWIERVSIAVNRYADRMASHARIAVQNAPPPTSVRTLSVIDVETVAMTTGHEHFLEYAPRRKKKNRQRPRKDSNDSIGEHHQADS